jgi:hypothetical protein
VVGYRDSRHPPARRFIQQLRDVAGAVEKTEVRVQMQVNELWAAHVRQILSPVAQIL